MKKIILWSTVAILALVIMAGSIFWLSRPQVITLKNGTRLTLVGVSYGKHHVFRGIKTAGLRLRGHAFLDTTNNTLVVWIEAQHKASQWPNFQLLVFDPDDTACVSAWQRTGSQVKSGINIEGFVLDAFPRRAAKMVLRASSWNNMGRSESPKGEFVIANPAHRSFPEWQPETLPDEQSDGDLDVTLTHIDPAARFGFGPREGSSKDPRQRAVKVTFHVEQNGNAVTNWQPVRIETSDATGNLIANSSWSNGRDANNDPTMTYQWGLWPDEKAWKLRVEMSRTAGFSSSETWSVANVPVRSGKWQDLWNSGMQNNHNAAAFAETTINGIHLKIFPAVRTTDQNWGMGQQPGGFRVTADPDLPAGYRLSLAEATNEHGHKLPTFGFGPNGGNGNYVFQIQDIGDAKFLNLTLALHKSRFVEFTVKPVKQ